MLMVWEPRWNRVTDSMRFDSDLHFQYWREYPQEEGLAALLKFVGRNRVRELYDANIKEPSLELLAELGTHIKAYEVLSSKDKAYSRNKARSFLAKEARESTRKRETLIALIRKAEPAVTETMSLLGACWFLHRDFYWDVDGSDEAHGSWGQQGTEIACKAWLSGGKLVCNKNTWYSHLFRTQPGFGFPYPLTHGQTERARSYSKSFWREGRWSRAVRPLSWLVEKFWPVPGWKESDLDDLKATEAGRKQQFALAEVHSRNLKHAESAPETGLTKGIVYFTDNQCREPVFSKVQRQIRNAINGHQVVSVSLRPIDFGDNFVLGAERSYVTMFQQILMGLSQLDTDFAFLCEHDVLYAPEHFLFTPPRKDVYYYNQNRWFVSARTGQTLFRYCNSTSQLCADRLLLLDHYRERLARVEKEGFSYRNGFEPGTRRISHGGFDNFPARSWFADRPNVDIRDHGSNLTKTLWKKEAFRNPKYTAGWKESHEIPGWGVTLNRFDEWLKEVVK